MELCGSCQAIGGQPRNHNPVGQGGTKNPGDSNQAYRYSWRRPNCTISGTSRLSPFERELIRKLVSQLSNIPEVRRILLFGSRARGLSNEHSDLDVAVVTDTMDSASRAAVEEAKWEALPEDSFLYANVITVPAEQLAADTAFSCGLNEEGIEIWTRSEKAR